uniref:Uncharacterized protein n=1 Tax=Avena sativa TaxID=4498 RepID=A0ACD5UUF7_AVESA
MPAHPTDTAPPPPTSEPTAATGMKPPPSAAEADAPPKKRKLEEVGFHHSPYYKIRAAVANLRGRFLQVCRATDDSQKEDAALEILKEIKVVTELSKKMRLDISAGAEPVKQFDIPVARDVKNKPAERVPSGGKNQVPQTGQDATFLFSTDEKVPLKPVISQAANRANQLGERVKGSYVIGGSPMGWNFRMWPGGKAVYYGLSKAEWLALQAAK